MNLEKDALLKRGKALYALEQSQCWDILDLVLDNLDTSIAENGTQEGHQQGLWIGFHVGALVRGPTRERPAFKRLVERYQAALDRAGFTLRAEDVLGITRFEQSEEQAAP
jgi:hypothetical protein